ncbi:2-keto-4-pentenoate hydratase/2-oxohepta-3-ene-1,7-dioic acid hydratase in catechol pathway [Williamsia limnetica]|uniref:2-keto-4-pentenoate hydratase/2-oxohepta-3-ene-1,7-dioic acid hydratase in catechol pathway n=1 Tax=Williamsia limnetica TaxID=882452 RepID=A0A318RM70_WILLI|nr:alpha/beta fold hydrolase [Williamsia limnetica]PYE15493.1 2-keto-4-pentenoate hydratase/2-oxohepta-3-ene-1,7-dioic acid hydratase in catechol pathway [Williamsia limnetica]
MRFARIQGSDGARLCAVDEEGAARAISFADTGEQVRDLQSVIAGGPNASERLTVANTAECGKLLAPIVPHRNVFCVGRNYSEHAAEFAKSGFDATGSADGQHVPDHPVVFTKPAATVIASGDAIDPHTDITSALDYEGEIGVIIGKRASKVSKADALDHVWGYTLINDMTARDLQRDHKQWFIGKSLDTFCPLGPWAVSADEVDITDLQLQTHVNGEQRQNASTAQLIFDVPTIIETLSAGITLEPGDVIATGTPVGVGIGFDPPQYLKVGDEVTVSATGLGVLRNVIGEPADRDHLTRAGAHRLFTEHSGEGPVAVLIHGLGGATTIYEPQVKALAETHRVLRYDLSGHGRSPFTGPNSIDGWVRELLALLDAEGIDQAALVAHSMGTLVATTFAERHPARVSKLALLGAVRQQPDQAKTATRARARTVRADGMSAVADTIVAAALSEKTKSDRPLSVAAVRELLLGQNPDGYASACEALAAAVEPDFASINAPVLLITGDEDKVSPVATNDNLLSIYPHAQLQVLEGVGHWHSLEDPDAVTRLLTEFLTKP